MLQPVNQVLADIQPSYIRALNDRKRPTSLNLGLGEPSVRPDRDLVEAGLERFHNGVQGYTTNAGLPELREHIARFRKDVGADAARMMVTLGSQEAVFTALGAMLNPGDEIVVMDPAFNIYGPISRLFGAKPVSVTMDPDEGFALHADKVRAAITPRTKAVCVVSPGNPTGRALNEKDARALAAMAEDTGVTLLVDEIYRELHHTPAPAPSPGEYTRRAITIGGMSKNCAMTGMRLGWVILPDYLSSTAFKLHQLCATCAPALSQHIAIAAFEKGALFRHRSMYTDRLDVTLAAVKEHLGLAPRRPEGAFYLMLDLRKAGVPSVDISNALLEHKDVVMVPGEAFGPSTQGFFRLSFAQDTPIVLEGIRRLGELLRERNWRVA
jgi:aminotransferase